MAAGDAGRATQEFQKFIDHPGVVLNFPLAALARLELARAFAHDRNSVRAHEAYQNFFQLWKNADPDLPIFKQAKAEYARLQ
jgi:eukaryotic-like serine/threonine-protein kinase